MFRKKPPEALPDWEKELHPSWRRYTAKYRKKKRIVRDLWIISALLMISMPVGWIIVLALATTFIGLVILDETG